MSITKSPWDLHKGGAKDAARHLEKLKDAFKKKLHEVISEEEIITSQNGKTVRVPIKALDSYHFTYDQLKQKHVGQGNGKSKVGDKFGEKEESPGSGDQAGDQAGDEYYEAEISIEELIQMMLEDLNLPRLDPKKKANLTVPDVVYDDIRKKGMLSNLDKKRTLINNIKRNAAKGEAKVGDFDPDDLRFRTWTEKNRPVTSAVVIAMMDVSGSMGRDKKYIARSFFFWMVNFLRAKYDDVEVVFLAHTTEAKICTEEEFFHRVESGGTKCSSVYELAKEVIDTRYDPNLWNIFAFHFSDGDNYGADNDVCVKLVNELLEVCNMVGYSEVNMISHPGLSWNYSTLFQVYSNQIHNAKNFVQTRIASKDDVWPALKKYFSDEIEV